jgi:predicted nucleotidyltransferase
MNIHITKNQHEYLQTLVKETHTIGSKLYGTDNENSDTDLLCIYKIEDEFIENHLSRLPSFHQFQFKDVENNNDYIYTTKNQFFMNQSSGDSTINSDLLMFRNDFELDLALNFCYTYKVIKGYLGFAKRDLKQYKEGKHKLIHAMRGLYCAESLMNKNIPSLEHIRSIYHIELNVHELLDLETYLRQGLAKMLQDGEINQYHVPQVFGKNDPEYVFQLLLNSNNTTEFKY